MTNPADPIRKVMAFVLGQTMMHFANELDISVRSKTPTDNEIDMLSLRDITASSSFGPPFDVTIGFSFDLSLAEHIVEIETRGLRMDRSDIRLLLREVVAETINVILGRCTEDLSTDLTVIALSPPTVIEEHRLVRREAGARLYRVKLETVFGAFDLVFIHPAHLLAATMNSLPG